MFDCFFEGPPLEKEIMNTYEQRHSWIHPLPWLEHFQLALREVFTRLKIVIREKGKKVLSDKTIGMFEVFKPHKHCKHPRRVLIEADPGMGKTTYCEKMCLDWSTGSISEPFPSFPLVILLKCRDLATDDIMAGIADQLLPKDVPEKEALFNYIKENPSKVLLVVDGMDELKEVDLSDLIQGKILSQIYLLVTTRQEAGIKIRQYFDSLFEIVGFTVTDAKNYITKYFKSIGKEDKAQCLLKKIDETFNEDGTPRTQDAAYLKVKIN